jgi:thiamine biosynthesis lipoprotein
MSELVRRLRPALGTLVELQVSGLPAARAVAAIDAAYAELCAVHRLMSFHRADSDLGRLRRAAPGTTLRVDPRTFAVLAAACRLAAASCGRFDPTVGPRLVALGFRPSPAAADRPDPRADWRDIELLPGCRVRLRRRVWLDLGGIAKGYAVDRAVAVLRAHGAPQGVVNAGGDLRVFGAQAECVHLRVDGGAPHYVVAVELTEAALATSSGFRERKRSADGWYGPHLDGSRRRRVRTDVGVSVVAESCLLADALTKIVLAADAGTARRLLGAFRAQALWHDPESGWRRLDGVAA